MHSSIETAAKMAPDCSSQSDKMEIIETSVARPSPARPAAHPSSMGALAWDLLMHDLNNLLSIVTAAGESAQSELRVSPDRVGRDLEDLLDAAARARTLLGELARGGPGPSPVVDEPDIDLRRLVESCVRLVARVASPHVALKTSSNPSLPHVPMRASVFERMLINLLTNAIDACSEGGQVFELD